MAAKGGRRRKKIERFLQKEFYRLKGNLQNESLTANHIKEHTRKPELQETPLNAL
ncbi:hypothetical protein [Bacillus sp. FJAT-27251]|uniref:hypothetical protein n=1 Tax=Bacillus sp. FJAT-27251 TaxID=1684142 RepID=UPI000AE97826|nr:hypothetical protein [Bacillus sp. FJAT-27251]